MIVCIPDISGVCVESHCEVRLHLIRSFKI